MHNNLGEHLSYEQFCLRRDADNNQNFYYLKISNDLYVDGIIITTVIIMPSTVFRRKRVEGEHKIVVKAV